MQRLKDMRIWACWNCAVVRGNKTKKPISVHCGETGADEAHSCTWGSYGEAIEAKDKYGYDGINFIVPRGWFFLDIDDRDLQDPFVQLLIERFPTYIERYASGNGFYIYGMCDLLKIPRNIDGKGKLKLAREFYTKHPAKQIELYIGGLTNRLAVFTGNAVNDVELTDCTDAILTTLDKDMRRKPKIKYSALKQPYYQYVFVVTDIYGNKYYSDTAVFEMLYTAEELENNPVEDGKYAARVYAVSGDVEEEAMQYMTANK